MSQNIFLIKLSSQHIFSTLEILILQIWQICLNQRTLQIEFTFRNFSVSTLHEHVTANMVKEYTEPFQLILLFLILPYIFYNT